MSHNKIKFSSEIIASKLSNGKPDFSKLATLIPLNEIEPEAMDQIKTALSLPIVRKLAIMPDVHSGYDLPIGAVALLERYISPSYVGYDIGCGMCTVLSHRSLQDELPDIRMRKNVYEQIYLRIPTGFASQKRPLDKKTLSEHFPLWQNYQKRKQFTDAKAEKLRDEVGHRLFHQLGTLGGGNHFIEIGADQEGRLAVTIHSGSRNMGHQIASYYMKKGRFLQIDSEIGQAYLQDMDYAILFAAANRRYMMDIVLEILGFSVLEREKLLAERIEEAHNFAEITENGILHRKGATPAMTGQWGIIPANMRDGVYVTKGLGNEEFLQSASHGAGRKLSRKAAQKNVSLEQFARSMQGIVARVGNSTVDESPFSYKNIDKVLKYQNHIVVEKMNHIRPCINVKG